jgi:glycerol-3-phosphate acyltransferase PlsY
VTGRNAAARWQSSSRDDDRDGSSPSTVRPTISPALAAVVGYGLGTVPSSDVAARMVVADRSAVREHGTGNPGGLNASHVLGRRWGAAVGLADIAKGVAAASVGRRLAGERGANIAASAAVLGHCHPPGRRGGKGVATSVGQVIGTFPVYLPVDVAVALSTAALPWFKRRTEVATTVAAVTWVGCGLVWWRKGWPTGLSRTTTRFVPLGALASSVVILNRFRAESHRVDSHNETEGELRAVEA